MSTPRRLSKEIGMRYRRLGEPGHEIPVACTDQGFFDLRSLTEDLDGPFLTRVRPAIVHHEIQRGRLPAVEDAAALRVGAPVARPGKVVCIGLNYRDHAQETGAQPPREPVVFMKDPATVVGPYDTVLIPRGSTKTDWEVELGVVIGAEARYLETTERAAACIAGYVVSHDVSERAFQLERGGQWDKGKSCETFNPLGPDLVTPDEVEDVQRLEIGLSVNGIPRQQSSTAEMVFGVHHLVWYLSQFMVLHPGDLINTGTPAGVALGTPEEPYLRPGDVVELSISGLGTARQRFEAAP
jgi:2-keto-4-pentenoate hydratase/2-oxohepta-3-ene-1,7-dioic acid hydratase in catechol pathway